MVAFKTVVRLLFMVNLSRFLVANKEPWKNLPNNTGKFCPSRDVCYWRAQRPYEYSALRESCCRGMIIIFIYLYNVQNC